MSKEEALRLIKEAAETGATELWLLNQGLTELPPELFELKNLTVLNLGYNQLTSLPPEIFQLKNLTDLNISFNQLSSLPSELFQLKQLTSLGLLGNWISPLPTELFQLKELEALGIGFIDLLTLPPEICQLKNLVLLDLTGNKLTTLPAEICQLKNLITLNLSDNQLTSLPPEIAQLPKLKWLTLLDNPLISPPLEIVDRGIKAIRSYLASLERESRLLAEVKVILVGEGASGKTSLTRLLQDEQFNPNEPTTHGIRIKKWQAESAGRQIRCNLWDFGGQEIMRATHQFFLSRRSLYVLVLDGRRDEQPEYWLRYIESFGGGSPVLVVLNKCDTNPSFDVDRIALRRKFPFIKGFWRTSCNSKLGVDEFKQALREELGKVQFIETRWANTWFYVKETLEQMNEPCISYEEFQRICKQAGVEEKISREVLLAFLHDLGIVIHFTEFELDENHVLDPKWVTEGVYKIINAKAVADARGLLKLHDLRELLAFKEGDSFRYERNDHHYFIELMKKFELCYELPNEQVLIPQLLPVPEPCFEFDYDNALRFELRYEDFLPPAVMPSFIVNRHKEIKDNLQWRSGVVLKNAQLDASAVVRADNETRRIHIAVIGRERKVFLALIWLTLREINADFKGLKVSERVPMPDEPELTVDYETLLAYAEQGLKKIIPEGTKRAYSVQELLERVHFANESEGRQMLALAGEDKKEGKVRSFLKLMNKYGEFKPNAIGLGFNFNAFFDDLLKKKGE